MRTINAYRSDTRNVPRYAAQRPHWSYSQLAQFLRCPLQYYFERILKLERPFVSSGMVFGSSVHMALEEYHRRLQFRLESPANRVREAFCSAWHEQEAERPMRYGNGEKRADLLETGISLIENYLREPPPENIIGVEEPMIVPLHNSRGDFLEKPLVAVVDLLCRDEVGLGVVEFKTSKRKFGKAELEASLQATCYRHAVQERFDEPVSFRYKVLVKTKSPQIQDLVVDRNENDAGRLGDVFEAVQRAIDAEAYYPVESPMNCSTCPYRVPCREWQDHSAPTVYQVHVPEPAESVSC